MLKPIIAAACACVPALATAAPAQLTGQEVRTLIAGATVTIDAPLGNTIPLRYDANGRVTGEAGGLAWYLGSPTDQGRWWIKADQLCHKWNRWFDSEPQCLSLSKHGTRIHWVNQDGKTGTAAITVPAPVQVAARDPAVRAESPRVSAPPRDVVQPVAQDRPVGVVEAPPPAPPTAARPPKPPAKQADPEALPRTARAPAPAPRTADPPAKAQPDPTRVAPPGFVVTNVAPGDVLNVRSGPSHEYDIVGRLAPGTRGVTIVGTCRGDWCPIQQQAASGWVNRTYLAGEADYSDYAANAGGRQPAGWRSNDRDGRRRDY